MTGAELVLAMWLAVDARGRANAIDLFQRHEYAAAIPALETAAQQENPDSDSYREVAMMIGQSYFMLAQVEKAVPWLEKVPPTNESSYMLGYAYHQTGQLDKSADAFAKLFGVTPRSAAAHLLTGQMLMKRHMERDAGEEVAKALALDPKLPEAHFLLGEIAMFYGRVDESIRELQSELQVNPNFAMAWYRLGDGLVRQNRWDEAIVNLQRSAWLNQNYSGPFILLGKCYFKKQQYASAEKFLRQALSLDPKNYTATYYLGETLVASGKGEEGREMLKRSAALRNGAAPTNE
jgi:tetratricopeptide (TPR) repeat protein